MKNLIPLNQTISNLFFNLKINFIFELSHGISCYLTLKCEKGNDNFWTKFGNSGYSAYLKQVAYSSPGKIAAHWP